MLILVKLSIKIIQFVDYSLFKIKYNFIKEKLNTVDISSFELRFISYTVLQSLYSLNLIKIMGNSYGRYDLQCERFRL